MENKLTPVKKVRQKNLIFKKEIFNGISEMIKILNDKKNGVVIQRNKSQFKRIIRPEMKKGRPPLESKRVYWSESIDPKAKKNLESRNYRKKVNQENVEILNDYNWLVDLLSKSIDWTFSENEKLRLKLIEDRMSGYIACVNCGCILKKQGIGKHEKVACKRKYSTESDSQVIEIKSEPNECDVNDIQNDHLLQTFNILINPLLYINENQISQLVKNHGKSIQIRKLTDFVENLREKELMELDLNGIKYFKESPIYELQLKENDSITLNHMEIVLEYYRYAYKEITIFNNFIDENIRFDNTNNLILNLNIDSDYWITITNISNRKHMSKSIFIYDFKNNLEVIELVKPYLKKMFPSKEYLMIEFVETQFVNESKYIDSGLFALAYQKALCEEKEPSLIQFNELTMRKKYNEFIEYLDLIEFDEIKSIEGQKRRTKIIEIKF